MGRLIPAGTGLERYRNIQLLTELPKEEPQEMEPELRRKKPPRSISCARTRTR